VSHDATFVSPGDDGEKRAPATELRGRHALQGRVADAILEAAARTFASRGERANMDDVAEEAGVARATVYRYFPNRQQLLAELSRRAAESAHDRLVAARIDEVSIEEGVSRAVRAFVDVGDSFPVLLVERSHGDESDDFERLVATPLRQLLERGRSSGCIRDDIPAGWLAEALLGTIMNVMRYGRLGRDDTVAAVTSVFLDGARVRPPRAP
jgi:TetR/AcrR family transcriptional regulator, mexCD-oprJ operon repressor